MADPYGRKYVSAGNPYAAADGQTLTVNGAAVASQYMATYGAEDAPIVFAEDVNQSLLRSGDAILTSQGIVSLANARFALNKAGYNGPTDSGSIASAYAMLATPAPASTPSPAQHAAAAASIGGLNLGGGISGVPKPLIYAGLALVAYEMFFKRGHR